MALLQRFSLVILLFTLVACGGSEGGFGTSDSDSDTDVDTDAITLTLSISDSTVSNSQPGEVSVLVMQGETPIANRVVTFNSTLGAFSPDSRTGLTNEQGIATIILTAGTIAGAGEITASISSGETADYIGFTTLGDGIEVADTKTISLSISNTVISDAQPGEVTALVMRGGTPVSNSVVTFNSTLGVFSPDSRTGLTNEQGIAIITLTAGAVAGAGEITASLSSGEVSEVLGFTTLGDSIGTIDTITISLSISNTTVTGAQPVTVVAEVLQGDIPVSNRAVTFTSTLGAFSPISGTQLTDANGLAEITLTAGNIRGAGEIFASLSTGESTTVPLGFQTQGDDIGVVGDINVTVVLVDNNGNPTSTITSSKPGKAIATVNGITSPILVDFTSTVGEIPVSTAITDDNFQASVDVFAGDSLGAGSITATVTSGETGEVLFVIGSSTVIMGSGTPFVEGLADVSLEQISAGGTSVISVSILDDQGSLFTEPVEVNFTSSCSSQSLATISSPITTSNGIATSTYLATGCTGDDPINVTANAGGINLSASASINVLAADIGSIEFVSATPVNIGILGAGIVGGSENSTVIFKVKDTDGNPYNNRVVNFTLNTNVGGIQLSQDQATTNAEGFAQTVVNSGTVPTSVRVTAETETLSGDIIFSQSSLLVVSTGLPDQDSFSLSLSEFNPEAWNTDGSTVSVSVRMSDAFNNPVPDGTAVSFTTEGGSIEPSCVTDNGLCVVDWTSAEPRPAGQLLTQSFCTLEDDNNPSILCARLPLANGKNYLGQEYGGRATILATAIGEESFPDLNGNGRFDESEYALFQGLNISDEPYDLKEAFVDHNEDGFFNPGESNPSAEIGGELEVFSDFNENGVFDVEDGLYNGILCGFNDESDPDTEVANQYCADPNDVSNPLDKKQKVSTNVRSSAVIVMSGNTPYITLTATNDAVVEMIDNPDYEPETIDNPDYVVGGPEPETIPNPDYVGAPEMIPNPNFNSEDTNLYIAGESTGTVSLIIADLHNQPMPAGTIVAFSSSVGSIAGTGSFTWPSDASNGGSAYSVAIKGAAEPASGLLEIKVTTPLGLTTVISPINVIIQ